MNNLSPAVAGCNFNASDPVTKPFNASGGAVITISLKRGGYYFWVTVDSYVNANKGITLTVPAATQNGSTIGTVPVPAGIIFAIDVVDDAGGQIQVVAIGAAAGTMYLGGPVKAGANQNMS